MCAKTVGSLTIENSVWRWTQRNYETKPNLGNLVKIAKRTELVLMELELFRFQGDTSSVTADRCWRALRKDVCGRLKQTQLRRNSLQRSNTVPDVLFDGHAEKFRAVGDVFAFYGGGE